MSGQSDEKTSLVSPSLVSRRTAGLSKLATVVCCCIMIAFSVSLINFNKWLMTPNRFPYSLPLVMIHMFFCTSFSLFLRFFRPSLFPAFTDPDTRIDLDKDLFLKGVLPVATVFATSLVLTNIVYAHLGIAFMQMIKESNLVWVYFLSIVFALERFSMRTLQIVCIAVFGMSLALKGEMHFEMVGFMLQLGAVFCEAFRVVLQGVLLHGKRIDPLSYVLVMSPSCGLLLLLVLLVFLFMPVGVLGPDLALPTRLELVRWAPWLVADSILAFSLNVSIAIVIKYTGSVSYIMCGILKDLVLVTVSICFLHESVAPMQGFGFILQVFAVLTWSFLKSNPALFERGLLQGLVDSLYSVTKASPGHPERVPETEQDV